MKLCLYILYILYICSNVSLYLCIWRLEYRYIWVCTHVLICVKNICIIKQNIVVEKQKKQTKTTGDMVACMSALPRGMNISKSINRVFQHRENGLHLNMLGLICIAPTKSYICSIPCKHKLYTTHVHLTWLLLKPGTA